MAGYYIITEFYFIVVIANPLEKISGCCFFIGFTISKFHLLPFIFTWPFFNYLALFCYFCGYCIWIYACNRYPEHSPVRNEWFGFAPYKYQYVGGALIGISAIVCCLLGSYFPVLHIVSAWLFACSNILWFSAEYHKYKHPEAIAHQYRRQQELYINYSKIVTLLGFFNAAATTVAILCPSISLFVITAAAFISLLTGLIAANYWVQSRLHPPQSVKEVCSSRPRSSTISSPSFQHLKNSSPSPQHLKKPKPIYYNTYPFATRNRLSERSKRIQIADKLIYDMPQP